MTKRIFVAGHNGMVGRAIVRQLEAAGDCEIITRRRAALDLLSQSDVQAFFKDAELIRSTWLRPKLVVFRPTTIFQLSSSMKT